MKGSYSTNESKLNIFIEFSSSMTKANIDGPLDFKRTNPHTCIRLD